ncbi:hypothetical protein AcW1_005910 [Taiwanofungus camphoratus]|nr:hypothetical protein AcW2_004663 [Antrodia cinnamomea]KAI0934359.1 hypothetical protein AcV5_006225 [Antrodia cinnamomea]KAI0950350.1 hypothetical protein AcV7_008846 [Antrodia cinnamomea]KAI0957556.1 hypothetical protein AcW1_005910 [Antrodia cinnamomea]
MYRVYYSDYLNRQECLQTMVLTTTSGAPPLQQVTNPIMGRLRIRPFHYIARLADNQVDRSMDAEVKAG